MQQGTAFIGSHYQSRQGILDGVGNFRVFLVGKLQCREFPSKPRSGAFPARPPVTGNRGQKNFRGRRFTAGRDKSFFGKPLCGSLLISLNERRKPIEKRHGTNHPRSSPGRTGDYLCFLPKFF
jgi:hypothetical protein